MHTLNVGCAVCLASGAEKEELFKLELPCSRNQLTIYLVWGSSEVWGSESEAGGVLRQRSRSTVVRSHRTCEALRCCGGAYSCSLRQRLWPACDFVT